MMIKKVFLPCLLLSILVLAGCGAAFSESDTFAEPEEDGSRPTSADAGTSFAGELEDVASVPNRAVSQIPASDLPPSANQEILFIRTGDMSIVVADTDTVLANITQMAEGAGGWVVSSSVFQYSDDAKTGDITIRIPAAGFNRAVEAIKALALEVTSESTSGQDVTEEFVDLSARLDNLEATADRVRNFLDVAKDVEEALAVNVELSRLEGEIEVTKGRMQYLQQSSAFSTLTVHLTPDVLSQPIEVGGWRPQGVARDAVEALIGTMQVLARLLIWFAIYILPLTLVIGIPLWLFGRFISRRRRRRRAAASAE
jgi:hypothetical protein